MSDTRKNFYIPSRQDVTREPDPQGRWSTQFPDMIGYSNQGGGKVPEDFAWRTNPKQWQEELTEEALAARPAAAKVLAPAPVAPALPAEARKA